MLPYRVLRKGASLRFGIVAALVAQLSLAGAVTIGAATLAQAQSFVFSNVSVEGNRRIDTATIVTFAGIARGESVSAGELNAATQRIVNSGLFESVTVTPRGGTLAIEVVEYPTVNVIAFEGNRRLDDEDLDTIVQLRPRRVYTPAAAEADAARITDAYRQEGRLAATVTPRIIRRSDNRVDVVFEILEGRTTEIERLSFTGNRAFGDRRLRAALETKQAGIFRRFVRNDTLIEDRLEFDKQILRDFYVSRGYIDMQVLGTSAELTRDRGSFLVTFQIREGQQFRFGQIDLVSEIDTIDAADYQDAIRLRPGVVYSPALLEETIARIERLAISNGENFVRVDPRITRNDRDLVLDIELAMVRGPRVFVERIDIEGNTTTLDQVVRRQFDTVEGDPFNPREIRASAERIRALGFFTTAEVQTREGSGPDQVIVDVNVDEAPTGSLGFGASYGNAAGFGLTLSFSERNFLGRGQSLSFELNTTEDAEALSFSFTEPAWLGRDVAYSISAAYRQTVNENSRYSTRVAAIEPSLSFPVSERGRLRVYTSGRYRELFDVDRGDPLATPVSTGSSDILRQEEGSRQFWAIGAGYSYDSRNTGLNPDAGILFRFNQEFGLGDAQYSRTTVLAAAETRAIRDGLTLRAELEAGALSFTGGTTSTVLDRFTLNNQIRGFEPLGIGPRDLNVTNQDALGGNMFAVLRLEAEFPLGLPEDYGITGGLFYDIGSVWSLDNINGGPAGANPVDDSMYMRQSVGFSIFWRTAIGPLRLNFSEVLDKQPYDIEQPFDLTITSRF